MKKPLLLLVLSLFSMSTFAAGMFPRACPTCFFPNSGTFQTMPSFFPAYYPWWAPYGAMSYSNFYYPGMWNQGGMWGPSYPGTGPIMAMKPNLYLEAPVGKEITVKIELAKDADWLIAVPARASEGWKATVTSTAQNSIVKVRGVEYPYFYYDFRLQDVSLQDSKGFCSEREQSLKRMLTLLREYRFSDKELRDFERQWAIKLPPLKRFCVWPQVDRELQAAAKITVEPAQGVQIRRVLFVVQDEEMLGKLEGKFSLRPTDEWVLAREVSETERMPAASGTVHLREWGLAFIDSSRAKPQSK